MNQTSSKRLSVCISTCLHHSIDPDLAQTLCALGVSTKYALSWMKEHDALITRSRSHQASKFLFNSMLGDVLVFLDDDILFTPRDFDWLVETCMDTKEIVCGLYVVRDTVSPHPACALFPGQQVKIGPKEKPVPILYGATGFMAIHREALQRVARTLPLVFSGPRQYHLFFPDLVVKTKEGPLEHLSEDYGWCFIAAQQGIKTWLDCRCKVIHRGTRDYDIRDLGVDAFKQTVTMTINEGGPDMTGVVDDLMDYWGKTREEIYEIYRQTKDNTAATREEWHLATPQTPEEVEAYYRNSKAYLMELVIWNTSQVYWKRVWPASKVYGKVIDFGGGIGTLTIKMAGLGTEVTYIDLPSEHRKFAEFRFAKRDMRNVKIADSLDELPSSSYDAVVALDVLEHIHPEKLPHIIAQVWRVLKPKGLFSCVNDFSTESGNIPQHFTDDEKFISSVLSTGFARQSQYIWKKALPNELREKVLAGKESA